MNGLQISYLLSMDAYTSHFFRGIVMRDSGDLPYSKKVLENPGLYILNTDSEMGKGEHWCAAFFSEKGDCEFFDPFGSPPAVYQLDNILSMRQSEPNVYNIVCLQDVFSKTCGHHCLFFSHFRCRGMSFIDILKFYDQADVKKNDKMVIDFITKYGKEYYPMRNI
jgi:hypothetical protein